MAGPLLNESTACRLTAYVGEPFSFSVYAEDVDRGDVARIYVLEDPGIPNNAHVMPDSFFQRCLPTAEGPVADGASLGACPMCTNSGVATYGFEVIPDAPNNVYEDYARNLSASSVPLAERVWCMPSTTGNPDFGDGKAEPVSEHGRLAYRRFVWTPLPEQGICEADDACVFIVKFQAFDSNGQASAVKTFEIGVMKAKPQYSHGTYGLIPGVPQERVTDPATGRDSSVSTQVFEVSQDIMVDKKEYPAYINCPMEFAIGVMGPDYDVSLVSTTEHMPPGATIEWRYWNEACHDDQMPPDGLSWKDKMGYTCKDYADKEWCMNGAAGPNFASSNYTSFADAAAAGWVPPDRACCVCGAGHQQECGTYTSQGSCESLAANGETVFARQRGCVWDGATCRGQVYPFFVSAGPFASSWQVSPTPMPGRRVAAIFKWTPVRGMEGQSYNICWRGSDIAETRMLPEVCAHINVIRCHYCARVGENLKYVAEQYNFDTNWLRLWNYNPHITDPDMILRSYLPLAIGSIYTVQPGDTVSRIAARLRTTVKKVLEVNPDMESTDIEPLQELCIMPCTENPFRDSPLNPYQPGAINGLQPGFVEDIPRLSRDPPFGGSR
mmetsp:Transcript_12635/g.19879  ORF Transcript_12635/g.19879 Transcript_12635/m.19879 type:complete len:610 (+) Transcript_12635:235-2064(+)